MARFFPHPGPFTSSPLSLSGSGAPRRFPPPPNHPEHPHPPPPPPPSSNGYYMDNLASMIHDQPRKTVEALTPYFASLRAEIDSLKASVHHVQTSTVQLQQDVSKVQHDVSKISGDVSNVGETLGTVVRVQQSSVATSSSSSPLNAPPGRLQANSRDAMPSTDVEMTDAATQYKARPGPSSSARPTPAHLASHVPIRDPRRADTATSPIQQHWTPGETRGSFSKLDWENQVSTPSQSTPAPVRQCPTRVPSSSRGSSGSPLVNNSSSHPSISPRSGEPNEVQQLPSPPEIPTQSQSEEAFVRSELQPDSQSPSQSMRDERPAETPARPVTAGKPALLPTNSVSSLTSNSTGLFSPISPEIPSLSRTETLKSIMDLLQRQEGGMPMASFAMAELPDLQYPTQSEEIGEEERYESDKERDSGNAEKVVVEKVGMTDCNQSYEEDPFAMSSQMSELQIREELLPQNSMRRKMPLFLPDSEPPSVKSMSPALVIPPRRDKSPEIQSKQPYYDREDEVQEQEQEHKHDHQAKSPDSSQDIRRPMHTSSDEVEAQLTILSEIESSEESSDDEGGDEDDGEEIDELSSLQGEGGDYEPGSFDSRVECERTLLIESQRREEGYRRESGVEYGSVSQEELARMLIPENQEVGGYDGDAEAGSASQAGVARMLIPQSQEIEGGGGEAETASASQAGVARMLIPQSQEVEGGSGEAETGSASQAGVARMLLPESRVLEEGTLEDIRSITEPDSQSITEPESHSITEPESQSLTQLELHQMLAPQSQIGGNGGDEAMEDVHQEPETQIDLPKMLIPQSQIGGDEEDEAMEDVQQELGTQIDLPKMLFPQSQEDEIEGREDVEVTRRESSRDSVPSSMNPTAEPRNDDNNQTTVVESSIDNFTPPRTEVRDPIESFQSMEERQGQGQGQGEFDRQMQVDDDGSQPQFEDYHHEAGHLSPDLSYQDELEKSSSGQLGDSVQPAESNPLGSSPLSSPLSSPHRRDAPLEGLMESSTLPSTQVLNNHFPGRDSGTGGDMPPSPLEPSTPMSSMPVRNRTQQQAEPVVLPDYISPVNSPSPSKSPLPALVGGRKRRFQEMQSLSIALGAGGRRKEHVKQVQLVSPTRDGRENKKRRRLASASASPDGAHNAGNVGSGGGKKVSKSSDSTKVLEERRNRVGLTMNLKKNSVVGGRGQGRSEENPIYLSSDPSTPTDEVGGEGLFAGEKEGEGSLDFIDLTDSPVSRSQAAKVVEEQGSRKGKEKEKEKEKEKKKEKEKEKNKKEDEKKKKKAKEKKMMPFGTEDSDDAEVIPARAFKAPKAVSGSTSDDEQANQQRNGKKSNKAANVPILNLNGIRDRQNKAMTKVKRKVRQGAAAADENAPSNTQKKAVDKDGEPPLQRARGRSDVRDTSNAVPVASSSKRKPPRMVSIRDSTTTTKAKWPKKRDAKSSDDRMFVRCDKCNKWYHYGCVGVSAGDDRLKDDASFTCPPCSVTGAWGRNTSEGQRSKRQSASRKNSASEICARPDCSYKDMSDDREFWVNRIVGRKMKMEGGRGCVEVYLVEWEGYRLQEATWQEEDTMGNPAELIEEFVRAARKEGIDLDRDPNRPVFLKDALAAGWTADGDD